MRTSHITLALVVPFLLGVLAHPGASGAGDPMPLSPRSPEAAGALSAAELSAAEEKCAGGPTDANIPYMAYFLDGELLYLGDPPGGSNEAQRVVDEQLVPVLGQNQQTEFELLCWNQVAALFGVEVRAAGFSYWSAPGPLPGVRELLDSIQVDLERRHAATGAYSLDPESWPPSTSDVSMWFGVEEDEYVVSATHPRVNYVLFVASSPDVGPPGVTRPENANPKLGVKSIPKHLPPPLR